MRRLLFLLVAVVSMTFQASAADGGNTIDSAVIQSTFFGMTFGDSQKSCQQHVKFLGMQVKEHEARFVAFMKDGAINFDGQSFDFIEVRFKGDRMSSISFGKYFKTKDVATEFYKNVFTEFGDKYKMTVMGDDADYKLALCNVDGIMLMVKLDVREDDGTPYVELKYSAIKIN